MDEGRGLKRIRSVAVGLIASALLSTEGSAEALTDSVARELLSIHDPRPVAQVVLVLERTYGHVITYEDPPFVYKDDLVDMTDPQYAREHPNDRAMTPRTGALQVDRSTWPMAAHVDDVTTLTRSILQQYGRTGVARFRVVEREGRLHVFPAKARNAEGEWVERQSVLDVPITLSTNRVSGVAAVMAITDAVSERIGVRVLIGSVPLNLLGNYQCEVVANAEDARTVLTRVLRGTNTQLSWHLYYGPGPEPSYFMNIHAVSHAVNALR